MDTTHIHEVLPVLIEAMADPVLVVDRDRQVVAANRRYVDAFGRTRPDVVGSGCTESRHAETSAGPDRCPACEVLDTRRSQRVLRQIPDAGGVLRRYEATFSPILGLHDEVSHVIEVWRDVTERSRLEVQLSHGERLAAVGVIAAGVAHEINNPLASMLAGVEGLKRWLQRGRFDEEGIGEAEETLDTLVREIERGRETIEKLMLLGRSYDTAPGWVDLNQAVRDALTLLRYEMRKSSIEVVEDLDPDLPPLWAREAGIRGICMNLMINAVQAMPGGGTLTVVTRRGLERVRLSIIDTGMGIAAENLGRIWDPFFSTKPVGQGTGLGLSITNQIVTRHAGTITVESTPGRGARFDVDLPIHGTGGDV